MNYLKEKRNFPAAFPDNPVLQIKVKSQGLITATDLDGFEDNICSANYKKEDLQDNKDLEIKVFALSISDLPPMIKEIKFLGVETLGDYDSFIWSLDMYKNILNEEEAKKELKKEIVLLQNDLNKKPSNPNHLRGLSFQHLYMPIDDNETIADLAKLPQDIIIDTLKSASPNYNLMQEIEAKGYGSYMGGFASVWTWNIKALEKLSNIQLAKLYFECKQSFDN